MIAHLSMMKFNSLYTKRLIFDDFKKIIAFYIKFYYIFFDKISKTNKYNHMKKNLILLSRLFHTFAKAKHKQVNIHPFITSVDAIDNITYQIRRYRNLLDQSSKYINSRKPKDICFPGDLIFHKVQTQRLQPLIEKLKARIASIQSGNYISKIIL